MEARHVPVLINSSYLGIFMKINNKKKKLSIVSVFFFCILIRTTAIKARKNSTI